MGVTSFTGDFYKTYNTMDNKLNSEQILCLQLLGNKPAWILKTSQYGFNKVLQEQEGADIILEKAIAILKKQEKLGIITLPFHHPDFPDNLRKIGQDTPPLIHLLGNTELLSQKAVAIIGAREADRKGCGAAYKWGTEYAKNEYVVVSGLALGCDAAAHQGCLDAKGRTIAVVATGLDITHPRENKALQNAILDNDGLLLSEQIIGVKANPKNLVARNRLQAALSEEVIVVQCPIQSGTMHTVRFAQKYGKKIYAVHSNKYDAKSSGNECLLEEGIASPL